MSKVRHFLQLASNLPNLEAMMFRTSCQIEVILTDKNIHHIEKDLHELNRSITLHIRELKSTNNTFTNQILFEKTVLSVH